MGDVPAVLFCATSASKLGSMETGCWLEEMAAPYYILKSRVIVHQSTTSLRIASLHVACLLQGFEPIIASTKGGKVLLDPKSTKGEHLTATSQNFLKDSEAMDKLTNSVKIKDVSPNDFVALYVPGGHGIMVDGPKDMKPLVEAFAKQDKLVSAVCHGPAAFTEAELSRKPLIKDKKVTSFSNSEEKSIGADKEVPFLLEDRLKDRGAIYQKGQDWGPYVVTDGKLITGQNPKSSEPLGKAIADALSAAIR